MIDEYADYFFASTKQQVSPPTKIASQLISDLFLSSLWINTWRWNTHDICLRSWILIKHRCCCSARQFIGRCSFFSAWFSSSTSLSRLVIVIWHLQHVFFPSSSTLILTIYFSPLHSLIVVIQHARTHTHTCILIAKAHLAVKYRTTTRCEQAPVGKWTAFVRTFSSFAYMDADRSSSPRRSRWLWAAANRDKISSRPTSISILRIQFRSFVRTMFK